MKKAVSIRFRLLRAITITIISIITFISAVVGYELYKRNTAQFNDFTAQQFINIEKSITLLIQNGKNVVTMLAIHPAVLGADETIYNYTIEAQKSGIIYTHTGKVEQEMVTLFKAIEESFPEFQDIYMGTRDITNQFTGFKGEIISLDNMIDKEYMKAKLVEKLTEMKVI